MSKTNDAQSEPLSGEKLRLFYLEREEDESGVSGTGRVADGVVFPDGVAVLRWRTAGGSTAVYDNIKSLEAIHGHGGKTSIVWDTVTQALSSAKGLGNDTEPMPSDPSESKVQDYHVPPNPLKDLWFDIHGDLAGWPVFAEAITRLITEAKVEELERLKTKSHTDGAFDYYNPNDWQGAIDGRVAELRGDKE